MCKGDRKKTDIPEIIRSGDRLSLSRRISLIVSLSWPAIMAQLSTILMEYIDASMVGSLGAGASASIGLIATTTWLFGGLGVALSSGFSVQVAHLIGAGCVGKAKEVLRQAIVVVMTFGVLMLSVGWAISGSLPVWLGGSDDIVRDSVSYFRIFSFAVPVFYLSFLCSSMLRCGGNMLVPGLLNVMMCVLDVIFNMLFIFPTRSCTLFGWGISLPGFGLGVTGAALGTAFAEIVTCAALLYYVVRKSPQLNLIGLGIKFKLDKATVKRAFTISLPMGAERVMMCGAQIITTVIVAPLGTAAIAANAFAITAEGLCYMPGYGISDAATTLVGQSLGAGRKDLAKGFANVTIAMGMVIMSLMGAVMWICAPAMMELFTPDLLVRELGTEALRTEAFAEPMFAASIVTYGVFVGAGYTLVPACMNLACIWGVRLSLAAFMAPVLGLYGVWLAMCMELCVRGVSFLIKYMRGTWMKDTGLVAEGDRFVKETR